MAKDGQGNYIPMGGRPRLANGDIDATAERAQRHDALWNEAINEAADDAMDLMDRTGCDLISCVKVAVRTDPVLAGRGEVAVTKLVQDRMAT